MFSHAYNGVQQVFLLRYMLEFPAKWVLAGLLNSHSYVLPHGSVLFKWISSSRNSIWNIYTICKDLYRFECIGISCEVVYIAKLLFHQSHTRYSDYTVTGQWRCSYHSQVPAVVTTQMINCVVTVLPAFVNNDYSCHCPVTVSSLME